MSTMNTLQLIKAQSIGVYVCKTFRDETGEPLRLPIQRVNLETWISEELLPLGGIYPSQEGGSTQAALLARAEALRQMQADVGGERGQTERGKRIINRLICRGCPTFFDQEFGCLLFVSQAEMDEAVARAPGHPGGVLSDALGSDRDGLLLAISELSGFDGARAGAVQSFPGR